MCSWGEGGGGGGELGGSEGKRGAAARAFAKHDLPLNSGCCGFGLCTRLYVQG